MRRARWRSRSVSRSPSGRRPIAGTGSSAGGWRARSRGCRGATPDLVVVDESVWARSPPEWEWLDRPRPPPDERKLGARMTISAETLVRDPNGAAENVIERLHRMLTRRADEEGMVLVGR